jgi:hypothetical protein
LEKYIVCTNKSLKYYYHWPEVNVLINKAKRFTWQEVKSAKQQVKSNGWFFMKFNDDGSLDEIIWDAI